MKAFKPRSIEAVAVVLRDDEILRPFFEQYGMRVEIYSPETTGEAQTT